MMAWRYLWLCAVCYDVVVAARKAGFGRRQGVAVGLEDASHDASASLGSQPQGGGLWKFPSKQLVFGYCPPHFNMESFERCHPARIRMGAEIRYWRSLAKYVAGDVDVKFVVTEADGRWGVNLSDGKYRYAVKNDGHKNPAGNPCMDYDIEKIEGSEQPVAEVPDILFCQFNLHDNLKEIYHELEKQAYKSYADNKRNDMMLPGAKFSGWKDNIYWSAKNHPVWKYKQFPCVFNWNMEPNWPVLLEGYTFSVNDIHGSDGQMVGPGLTTYLAEAAASLLFRLHKSEELVRPKGFDARSVAKSKKHFSGFMYRNCGIYENSIIRVAFFDFLSEQYKKVLALSDCRAETRSEEDTNNVQSVMKDAAGSFNGRFFVGMDEAVEIFRPFKFSFGMDNSDALGGLSEKLVNAYFGESVPIFYGGKNMADQLNVDAFVYCNISYQKEWERPVYDELHRKADWFPAFDDGPVPYEAYQRAEKEYNVTTLRVKHLRPYFLKEMQACADEIKRLDEDEEAYAKKLAQPLVKQGKVEGSIFDLQALGARIRTLMTMTEVTRLSAAAKSGSSAR